MVASTLQRCVFRNGYLLRCIRSPTYISIVPFTPSHKRFTSSTQNQLHKYCTYKNNSLRGALSFHYQIREFTTKKEDVKASQDLEKPSLYQRFKQMYRDYWYVLVPVHLFTSTVWLGSFYYMAKSGVDIIGLLENLGASEKWVTHLKESSMGYIAISYALYKIATPVRYAVTLGGTTVTINYLQKWGYIKPVPSTKKLKMMFTEGKDNIMGTMREKKQELIVKADQLKGKTMEAVKEKTQEKLKNQLSNGQKMIENFELPNVKKK